MLRIGSHHFPLVQRRNGDAPSAPIAEVGTLCLENPREPPRAASGAHSGCRPRVMRVGREVRCVWMTTLLHKSTGDDGSSDPGLR